MKSSRKIAIIFLVIVAMVSVACSSSSSDNKKAKVIDLPQTIAASEVPQGGELTIGAEQEPDCLDFIDICSGSSWGFWTVAVNTLPRAYQVERVYDGKKPTDGWEYKKTVLLAKDVELETDPVQKMTYTIHEDAVWSDGEPITGEDFVYTWDQIANGENIYDQTGWKDIKSVVVDKDDDKVVVVTMKTKYADWKALFGGNYGVLPSHLLKGKDRNAIMKDGYAFSGGPFMVEAWNKEQSIVLVPNDKYWGDKAHLDKVTFQFITDTTAEFAAFQDGEVSAIYPQPQIDVIEAINSGGLDDSNKIVNAVTGNIEALWLNNDRAPFDSKAVRQALGYSLDRDSIVKALFGGIGVTKSLDSFVSALLPNFADSKSFSRYKLDTKKADKLLTGDGWKKNKDGVYEKKGKLLEFEIVTTEGNRRRQLTMEVIQKQLQDLGWKVTLSPVDAGDLFGDLGPSGNFQAAIYAQVLTSLSPNDCVLFCSDNIPTEENDLSGNNWTRTKISEVDKLSKAADAELDEDKRQELVKKAGALLADDATSIPIDPLPNIFLWNKKVLGPLDENPVQGPFWNLADWGVEK